MKDGAFGAPETRAQLSALPLLADHLLLLSLSLYTLEARYSVGQSDRFCSPSSSSLGRAALSETVNQEEEFGGGGV